MTADGATGARPLRAAVLFAAVFAAYAAGALMAWAWFGAASSPVFFPSAGVTLAALALTRIRTWPVVLLAAAAAEVAVDLHHDVSPGPALGFALANVVEPAAGAAALRRVAHPVDISRRRGLLAFLALPVALAPLLGALVAYANVEILGDGAAAREFITRWWLGDGLGVLVVAGAILAWRRGARDVAAWPAVRIAEAVLLLGATMGSAAALFWLEELRWAYAPVVLMPWIAFRLGTRGVTVAGAAVAFLAAQAVADGHTVWSELDVSARTGLTYLQLLIAIVIATALLLAAEIAARDEAVAARGGVEEALGRAEAEAALASALNAAVTVDDVADAVLRHSRRVTGTGAGGLALLRDGAPETLEIRMMQADSVSADLVERASSLGAATATAAAIHARAPLWLRDVDDVRPLYPLSAAGLDQMGHSALAVVPLVDRRRRVLGALSCAYPGPREFPESERLTLLSLADRAAAALERVRLVEVERRARDRAERLEGLAAALAGALTVQEIATLAADGAADVVGAVHGVAGALTPDRRGLVTHHAARGPDARAVHWAEAAVDGPLRDVAASGASLVTREPRRAQELVGDRDHAAATCASAAVVPLEDSRGTRLGALVAAWESPAAASAENTALLEVIADLVGQAMERAHLFERERRIALDLQASLLPGAVHAPAGTAVGVRYQAGEEGLHAGGDWYETVALAPGRVGIAIGDVVGRGVRAAAAMGQLRTALAALAPESAGPAALLTRLDAFSRRIPDARLATVCYAELDAGDGALRYACAGHPPPLVVSPDGSTRFLEDARSLPLGVPDPDDRTDAEVRLGPGEALLLYTDGLVERRREPLDRGLARLAATAAAHRHLDPMALCDRLVQDLTAGDAARDDAAVLCLRREAVAAP